jgi:succinate-semialdehyde dehydrogenase/glutarate-semialdehyde dehydrogenase
MTQTPPYRVNNPATGEITQTFEFATDAEIEAALSAATEAFAQWRRRPVAERAAVVKRVAGLFSERATELAALITAEMGKRPAAAVGEAGFCREIFAYYADNGPGLISDRPVPGHDNARIEYRPVGPVLGVMPWNYPYYQVARFAAPNLIVGNAVILKHAENCPTSALAIAQLMRDAGVPDGVYTNLFATHEQVAAMIADPRLRGVSLTGSERAGAVVAETAGRNLKKVVLELGGSDPYIILDSDDVEGAAKTAWVTRMENVGQACNSNKRMIVMDSIYDDFVAALVKRASAATPRQPGDDSPRSYSPMVSRRAAENLLAQVQDAVAKGATLHVGGTLADGGGAYFAPAVLTGVTPQMRAYREELFGPVAVVYKVSSDDEAVQLANAVDFGLGGAVFSADEQRASRVAEQLEVGMTNVNTPAGEGADLPFGGTKRSGFGRELGPLGIDEFVNKRLFYVGK